MSKEAKQVLLNRLKIKIETKIGCIQNGWMDDVIDECLAGFNVELGSIEEYSSEQLLDIYLKALSIQGRSPKTIARYDYLIKRLNKWSDIPTQDLTVFHLRAYLGSEKDTNHLSNETLEGIRQVISAYFNWLHREGLILRNPAANLGPIKRQKKVKTTYSESDIEKLKNACKDYRDKAIVCFLYSTGCRISEMTQLNVEDINVATLECKVLGKGNKERTVYFDEVAGMMLENYLRERKDDNPALFVTRKSPFSRINPGGVRLMLHKLEEATGVYHVHPHKFRRTRATRLVRHGMPIQNVSAILGHEKVDTTMKYVVMDQRDIKSSYQKFA